MTPLRPHLIRALYDWVAENGFTPHILVHADGEGVSVPREHVQEGRIVLNIAARAVQRLSLGDEAVAFSARFGGVPREIYIPVASVLALYAAENGQGMVFSDMIGGEPTPPPEPPAPEEPPKNRPTLRVVK
ncbi:ClpXP protease specificity-enhancing factor [Endothiovibrio diazotrophicus]